MSARPSWPSALPGSPGASGAPVVHGGAPTGLAALGLRPLTGEANFLVEAGAGAGALIAGLAAERIALRPCVSLGLPNHIRVAARPPDEQDRLLAALGRLRDEGRG